MGRSPGCSPSTPTQARSGTTGGTAASSLWSSDAGRALLRRVARVEARYHAPGCSLTAARHLACNIACSGGCSLSVPGPRVPATGAHGPAPRYRPRLPPLRRRRLHTTRLRRPAPTRRHRDERAHAQAGAAFPRRARRRPAQGFRALGPPRGRTVKPLGVAGSAEREGRWRRPRSRTLGSKPVRPSARVEDRRRTATPRRKRTRSSLARDPGTAAAPAAREGERSRTSAALDIVVEVTIGTTMWAGAGAGHVP